MGRVCAAKDCDSGREKDKKKRQEENVRQATLFKVPKDDAIRQEWSNLLQQPLKQTAYVCDIHFWYRDLHFSDQFLEINGGSVFVPRGRITLKKNAKPKLVILEHEEYLQRREKEKENERLQAMQNSNSVSFPQNHNENEELMDVDEVGNQLEAMEIIPETPCIKTLAKSIGEMHGRPGWTWTEATNNILFAFIDFKSYQIRCYVEIHADMTVVVLSCTGQKLKSCSTKRKSITTVQQLSELQQQLEKEKWCFGMGIFHQSRSADCTGIANVPFNCCLNCARERLRFKSEQQRKNGFRFYKTNIKPLTSSELALFKKKCEYRKTKLVEARKQISGLQQQLEFVKSNQEKDLLEGLPDVQREIVEMFLKFKNIDSNCFRYSPEWICECFIMHTKSTASYEYIRERRILPLCSPTTLNTAVGNMQAAYGFQNAVFDSMKIKAASLPDDSRQGILLADEVSISKSVGLDKNWMVRGFTDLGSYTRAEVANEQADKALVLLFCPFRGQWVQPIAAFASKKLKSNELDSILLDGLKHIESTGFQVDAIGMDGANVNRKVWNSHEVNTKNISCVHPTDESRRLWFISDGSHLWKNWRTHVLKEAEFWTPDGIVKKKHWELLLVYENYLKYNLKIAYKLTPDHINPKGFQTMNVLMATQVFDDSVSLAMEMCMGNPKCPEMADAQPTIKFIRRVKGLIDAMTTRTPRNALQVDENCGSRKVIVEFTIFLEDWKKQAAEKNYNFPFPNNTYNGFLVTLKATLEIIDSLHHRYNYSFLMTSRLLSDPIERFFGILKTAAGCNSKPDPIIFIYLFKIFCCFNLIKSPKGSNVGQREVLNVLAGTKDSKASQLSNKTQLVSEITLWIEHQQASNAAAQSVQSVREHSYDVVNTDERVISDVSGWAVRRLIAHTRCKECQQSFQSSSNTDARHELTNAKERFGGLIRSSDSVFKLLQQLEDATTELAGTQLITRHLMQNLVNNIIQTRPASLVGCKNHEKLVTVQLITFYLDRRGKMVCDAFNKINSDDKKNEKQSRKNASLV